MMSDSSAILVTGAGGLLGRHVCLRLRKAYPVCEWVHALPCHPCGSRSVRAVDLAGPWTDEDMPPSVSTIIHLAQSSHFRDFPSAAMDVFNVNVESTARLLDIARRKGVRTFVYASSGGVYGSGNRSFHENSAMVSAGRLGYYLGSKLCGEILAQSYADMMQIVVLRFFFIYGRGQNRTMLIPRLIDNVKAGRAIALAGRDGIRVNPIHVEDAAAAVVAALRTTESATYNVAGPRVYSLRDIGELIGRQFGVEPRFEHVDQAAHDIVADIRLMKARLHVPSIALEEGIRDIVEGS